MNSSAIYLLENLVIETYLLPEDLQQVPKAVVVTEIRMCGDELKRDKTALTFQAYRDLHEVTKYA